MDSSTADRAKPESLIHEFMTLTRLKIDCVLHDGVLEFAKIATFKAFCVNNRITMEETGAYTHTFNASAKGAVRIVKEHMRCLLRIANLPRRFWPYARYLDRREDRKDSSMSCHGRESIQSHTG
jgi:hypothetical protein